MLFLLTEVMSAWSALDVFCVSIAASLLEIQVIDHCISYLYCLYIYLFVIK